MREVGTLRAILDDKLKSKGVKSLLIILYFFLILLFFFFQAEDGIRDISV